MKAGDQACDDTCELIYAALTKAKQGCALRRYRRPGLSTKFATADLIGVPVQIIAGPRAVANGEVEVKDRKTGARETMTIDAAINRFVA